jgi:hypothetical protein
MSSRLVGKTSRVTKWSNTGKMDLTEDVLGGGLGSHWHGRVAEATRGGTLLPMVENQTMHKHACVLDHTNDSCAKDRGLAPIVLGNPTHS